MNIAKIYQNIITKGITLDQKFEQHQRILLTNKIYLLYGILIFINSFFFIKINFILYIITLFISLICFICYLLNCNFYYTSSKLVFNLLIAIANFCYSTIFGKESAIHYNMITIIPASYVFFDESQKKYRNLCFGIHFITLVIFEYVDIQLFSSLFTFSNAFILFLKFSILISVFFVLYFCLDYLYSLSSFYKISISIIKERYKLTLRESEILLFIIKGLSNKEISQKLFIQETTVKTHLQKVFQKTNCTSRAKLISFITKS